MKTIRHIKESIVLRISVLFLLILHASFFLDINVIANEIIITALIPSIFYGLFSFYYGKETAEEIDKEAENFFGEDRFDLVMNFYKYLPLIISFFVIVLTQVKGSYEGYQWWLIAMMLFISGDIGNYVKYLKEYPNS